MTTKAQRVALANPCFLAVEVVHPRFMETAGPWSVRVTVNAGYE